MGGSDKPSAPEAVTSTYNNGFGGTSTTKMAGNNQSTTYTPSAFESQQYDYYKTITPQLQGKLYDQAGAESGADAYAGNIKALGLKRFGIDQAGALGNIQASNAKRFGSLSNSDYDTSMKTLAREQASALEDMNSQYDTNRSNYINDYNNRWTNLLGTANGIYNNTQTNANTMNNGSLAGYQAGNAFNQTNYQTNAQLYAADQAQKAAMYNALGTAVGGIGGGLAGGLMKGVGGTTKIAGMGNSTGLA